MDEREKMTDALAALFVGLMKADDGLVDADFGKIQILLHKMRRSLPVDSERLTAAINARMKTDAGPDSLLAESARVLAELGVTKDELSGVMEVLEVVAEVGTLVPAEEEYLLKCTEYFDFVN